MGSGDWLKNIISLKKLKNDKSKKLKGSPVPEKLNGLQWEQKQSTNFANGASKENCGDLGMPVEDVAATRIQTAFRALMARKKLRHLKRIARVQTLTQGDSIKKQASTTLSYLHSWSRIQAEIRARRICMVTEGRMRQKKLENQLKLEAKLHDIEVEWNGGSETMEEVLARIHMREEAAGKRERAMAYAFSHQWRANSNPNLRLGTYELGEGNWGWSWMDRWIAARPWEGRALTQLSPNKADGRQARKTGKNIKSPTIKALNSVKSISPNGKGTAKARKLCYTAAENLASQQGNVGAQETDSKREQLVS